MGLQARRVDGMTGRFDNTWGVVKESGKSLVSFFIALSTLIVYLTFCSFCLSAQVHLKIIDEQENFL